jgi:pSer/pThr/pTyr-binding forkhead associated (FHA) protein
MVTCASCSHENQAGVQFCDECGAKLEIHAAVPAAEKVAAGVPFGLPPSLSSGTAKTAAKLMITRGGTVGKEFPVEQAAETHIGRWDPDGGSFPEIDLTGDDPEAKISRKHARIFIQDGDYYLEDLGSLNGTYINRGPRLLPGSPERLSHDDEVVMGKTFFKVIIG